MSVTLPRYNTLPGKECDKVTLRLHKDLKRYLLHLCTTQSLIEKRFVSIGDLIRDALDLAYEVPDDVKDLKIEAVKKGGNFREPEIRLWSDNSVKGFYKNDLFSHDNTLVKG